LFVLLPLISQQEKVRPIIRTAACVMGFGWRPDGCGQVIYDPAGV
jgi:hypothetical protein